MFYEKAVLDLTFFIFSLLWSYDMIRYEVILKVTCNNNNNNNNNYDNVYGAVIMT